MLCLQKIKIKIAELNMHGSRILEICASHRYKNLFDFKSLKNRGPK